MTEMATRTEAAPKPEEAVKAESAKPSAKPKEKTTAKIKRRADKPKRFFDLKNATKIARHVLFGMLCGAALLLPFALVFHPHQPHIATVDVNKIVDEFVKSTAQKKLPPEKMQKNVEIFGKKLEETLKSVAEERHLILMPNEAVIAGAKDITEEVKEKLM